MIKNKEEYTIIWFYLISLFNNISNPSGLFNTKAILVEE